MSSLEAGLNALHQMMEDNRKDELAYIDRLIAEHAAPPPSNTLPVPWLSQLGPDADFAPGDCGPACWAMWALYLGHNGVTVDQVSENIGLSPGYRYTMPAHLIWAARYFDHDLYWRRYLSLDDIRVQVDAGQPIIILGHYGAFPDHLRYDPTYKKGHWFLIVGYDAETVTYLDPYWLENGRKSMTWQEFYHVWDSNYLDGNSNRQALRLRQ